MNYQIAMLAMVMVINLPAILNGQSLVVGVSLGEIVNINNTTVAYDTIYIMKDGVLNIDGSNVTVDYLLAVDSVGQLNVGNSNFIMNGKNIFYANSTSILKDSLSIKGDVVVGGNASLLIDSAVVDATMSYVGQYEFIGFDSADFRVSNSTFFLGNGKFGGGFTNSASFNQSNTDYLSSLGIGMTIGLLSGASYTSNNCSGGAELIITDSTIVDIDSSSWSLLWFSFANGSNANFDFPVQNSLMNYASDVSYYAFSDSLSGVSGVNYDVRIQNSDTVFWAIFPYTGSNVSINNSSVLGCGFTFNGTATDTLSNFSNDSLYSSYTAPITDRTLSLTNTKVSAWNFYSEDTTTIVIRDCLFGEVLTFQEGQAIVENSTCDGTGGYIGAYQNSQIHFKGSIIVRAWSGPPIILNDDNTLMVVEESSVSGNVMINSGSTLIFSNTVYDSIPQVNDSAFFLEVYIDSIPLAFTDSLVDINGTLKGVSGPNNTDFISRFRLAYSLSDSTNLTLIKDTSYTPSISNALIYKWNTNGVAPGNYILWLTTYVSSDSVVTTVREVVLIDVNAVDELSTIAQPVFSVYPNPLQTSTIISYEISKREKVEFNVYDITGNKLSTILSAEKESGKHNLLWETRDLIPGVYLIEFKVNNVVTGTKKVVVTQ